MSDRARTWLYVVSGIVLGGVLLYGIAGLQPFGSFASAYAAMILRSGVLERHVLNMATAVNFDYRGFDTMGEEFIFFTSLAGVLLIFSELHERTEVHREPMESPATRGQSGAIRWFPTGLVAFIAAMGMDTTVHGSITPGGGFQGGAIFGSAFLCIYLGVGYKTFSMIGRKELFDAMEALGAFAYVAVGVALLASTGAFLKNVLPLGQHGAIVSGGSIYLVNMCVFVEVASGFVLLIIAYLHQTRAMEESAK